MILFILCVYLFTLSNTLFGGDAGDLLSAIVTHGFPHPPGYALYTILGIAANSLPLQFLNTAGKVTLISTFSTASSIVLDNLIIKETVTSKYINKTLLAITSLIVGFNYLIWLYAVIPEVFPLNSTIILSIYYVGLKLYKNPRPKYFYLLSILIGLAIVHHTTFVLVLPSIFFLLYRRRRQLKLKKNILVKSLLFFLIGLLPVLYLIWASHAGSEHIWAKVDTLPQLLALLSRKDYGSFVASPLILNIPQNRFSQIPHLFLFILNDFLFPGVIFMFFGILFIIKEKKSPNKELYVGLLLNLFFFGPFFFFYANFPLVNKYYIGTSERFLHIFYLFLSIFIYLGLIYLYNLLFKPLRDRLIAHKDLRKIINVLILSILLVYPARLFLTNYPLIHNLKNDQTAERVGIDILKSTPRKSIIFLSGDFTLFNTLYIYHTHPELAEDRIIAHDVQFDSNYYMDSLKKNHPDLLIPSTKKEAVVKFMKLNKDKYSIFAEDKQIVKLSTQSAWITQGIIYKYGKKEDTYSPSNLKSLEAFWANSQDKQMVSNINNPKFQNFFTSETLRIYADAHQVSAQYYFGQHTPDKALPHILLAGKLKPEDEYVKAENYFLFSIYYLEKDNCFEAEKNILNAQKIKRDKRYLILLLKIGDSCFSSKKDKDRVGKEYNELIKRSFKSIEKF